MKPEDTFQPPRFTMVTRTAQQINARLAAQFSECIIQRQDTVELNEQSQSEAQEEEPESSGQLLADLDALQAQISDCRRVASVQQPTQNKFTSLQMDQLLPISISQKQEADENAGEAGHKAITSLDALNLDELNPEERVAVLRRHPDLLKAFMEEQKRIKQREREQKIEQDYQQRLKRLKQAGEIAGIGGFSSNTLNSPLGPIRSFVDHNMEQQPAEVRVLQEKQEALQRDLRVYQVLAQKQFIEADFEQKAVLKQLQPRAEPLVAQTFVLQRNRLLPICYVAGRLALLHEACAAYAAVHASNVRIETACLTLQTELRRYRSRSIYLSIRCAASLLQSTGRQYICRQHSRVRKASLCGIRHLLLCEYCNNTFLGAASRAVACARGAWDFFCFINRRKIARKALIQVVLDRADAEETRRFLQREYFAGYQQTLQKMLADPKQRRIASKMPQYTGADDPRFQPEITQDELQRRSLRADPAVYACIAEGIYEQAVNLRKTALEAQWKQPEFVFFAVDFDFCRGCCARSRELLEASTARSEVGGGVPAAAWSGADELQEYIVDSGSAVFGE